MSQIPDAPWIRDAELYGMPEGPEPVCPCCGRRCETIYEDVNDVVGCEHCVRTLDAYEWIADQEDDPG